MTSTDYQVQGMTCGHCAGSVSKELRAIDGVEQVEVDLPSGRVTVSSAAPLETAAVAAAVDEAGYTLVTG